MEAQTSWLVTPETKLRDSIATAANSIRQATSSNQKPHERDQKQIADELAAAWNADYGRGSPMSSPDVFETRPAGEAAPKRKRTKKEARKRALAEAKEEELAALRRQCDELQQSRDDLFDSWLKERQLLERRWEEAESVAAARLRIRPIDETRAVELTRRRAEVGCVGHASLRKREACRAGSRGRRHVDGRRSVEACASPSAPKVCGGRKLHRRWRRLHKHETIVLCRAER